VREMTLSQIAEKLEISSGQVGRMMTKGTVYLNGNKLTPDLETVNRVAQQMTGEASFVDKDGDNWSSENLALKNYRHARKFTLYRYRNKPCPQLGGDILHARQKPLAGIKANRWGEPWFYLDKDLERLRLPLRPGKQMNPNHSGRPRDLRKKEACEFCYQQLELGRNPNAILRDARKRFGIPSVVQKIREFAKLHAVRYVNRVDDKNESSHAKEAMAPKRKRRGFEKREKTIAIENCCLELANANDKIPKLSRKKTQALANLVGAKFKIEHFSKNRFLLYRERAKKRLASSIG